MTPRMLGTLDYNSGLEIYGVGAPVRINRVTLDNQDNIRPSVVLRSDVTIETGQNGTQSNPYVIS